MDSQILFILVFVQRVQQGHTQSDKVEADVGSEVTMICPFRKNTTTPIIWDGPPEMGRERYTIDDRINPYLERKDRISLVGKHTDGEYNLRLSNITHIDNGLYTCKNGSQKHEVILQIIDRIAADMGEDVCVAFFLLIDASVQLSVSMIRFNSSKSNTTVARIVLIIGSTSDDSVAFIDKRFSYIGNSTDKVIEFRISNLTRNDSGVYYTEIDKQTYIASLTVNIPLESVDLIYTNSTVEEHTSSEFICESMSYPLARIIWFLNDQVTLTPATQTVSDDTVLSVMTYTADRKDHKKTVHCEATNNLTTVISKRVAINVLYPPEAAIQSTTGQPIQVVGQRNQRFLCLVKESNPPVRYYSWYFNDRIIPEETKNTLNINTVTIEHSGTFGCKGDNGIVGGNLAKTRLTVLETPTPNVKNVSCNTSSTVTIACDIKGYDGFYYPLEWHHMSGDIVIQTLQGTSSINQMELTIEFCNYQDIGTFMCVWKSEKNGLNAVNNTGFVQVRGAPVVSETKITKYQTGFLVSVYFYSDPYPFDPVWSYDDKPLVYGSEYHKSTGRNLISLVSYGKKVKIDGFVTNLTILEGKLGMTFSYILENNFGRTKKSVTIQDFDPPEAVLSTGAISGIVSGCTLIVALSIGVIACSVRRKMQRLIKTKEDNNSTDNIGGEQYDMIGYASPPNIYEQLSGS